MSEPEYPYQEKKNLLGVRVSPINYAQAVDAIIQAAENRKALAVTALAVHGVMTGFLDRTQRHRLNQLDIITPDGQPVRWGLNWLHHAGLKDRVYGPTLMLKVCELAAKKNLPIYLYGTNEDTLAALAENLTSRFPGLIITGTCPSKFRALTEDEMETTAESIRSSGAAILFVGLGCPRQETWLHEMGPRLAIPQIAVGAAFDFHAGNVPQAPPFMQRNGLEWFYRLTKNPSRLWKRYIFLNPLYLLFLFLQKTGLKTIDPDSGIPPDKPVCPG